MLSENEGKMVYVEYSEELMLHSFGLNCWSSTHQLFCLPMLSALSKVPALVKDVCANLPGGLGDIASGQLGVI